MTKAVWWESVTDISDQDVIDLVLIYNSFITLHSTNSSENVKYYIKYNNKNFNKHKHYGDCIKLYRFLNKLEIKPREYLVVQFNYYKQERKHPYARAFPSIKHLASPAALERWNSWLLATKKIQPSCTVLSKKEIEDYDEAYLKDLIKSWGLIDERALFQDIVLTRNFNLDFLQLRPIFQSLLHERFYENTYGVKDYKELFF